MDEFKSQVKKGFASCKQDITALQEQNNQLTTKLLSLESENTNLKSQLDDMKSMLEDIKTTLQQQQSVASLSETKSLQPTTQIPTSQPQTRAPSQSPQLEDPYEALLAFKAKANKKDVLKQKMISFIGDTGMNLAELKFMFVEHFRYCSKATFYNYLKELELERHVRIERHQSKNIIFLEGMRKEI